jgi:Protein of unknown function (DUF1304).
MKRLLAILFLASALFPSLTYGEKVKTNANVDDSIKSVLIAVSDKEDSANEDSVTKESSLQEDEDSISPLSSSSDSSFSYVSSDNEWSAVAIVSIIMVFGLPAFVIAVIMWFRYKNRQAKYRLASEALAAGHEIPKELFEETATKDVQIYNKGIKNVFLGIGLGVFLWFMTEEIGLAAIGFMIFCMGLGEVIISYSMRKRDTGKNGNSARYEDKYRRDFSYRKDVSEDDDEIKTAEIIDENKDTKE